MVADGEEIIEILAESNEKSEANLPEIIHVDGVVPQNVGFE